MPLNILNYNPLDQNNPDPAELQEFVARIINASVVWHKTNITGSIFAKTLVESVETDINLGALTDSDIFDTLITTELDLTSGENFKLDGDRSLRDPTKQYYVKAFIRIRTKRVLGAETIILKMVDYLESSLTKSSSDFSSKLEIAQGWSDHTYSNQIVCNVLSSDQSSLVVDPETKAYFKEFAIIFAIYGGEFDIS
jgi:hypothetical protein